MDISMDSVAMPLSKFRKATEASPRTCRAEEEQQVAQALVQAVKADVQGAACRRHRHGSSSASATVSLKSAGDCRAMIMLRAAKASGKAAYAELGGEGPGSASSSAPFLMPAFCLNKRRASLSARLPMGWLRQSPCGQRRGAGHHQAGIGGAALDKCRERLRFDFAVQHQQRLMFRQQRFDRPRLAQRVVGIADSISP